MNLKNKLELNLENFTKCALICDADCPLGQLYDYASALKAFIYEKIKASEEVKEMMEKQAENSKIEPIPCEENNV